MYNLNPILVCPEMFNSNHDVDKFRGCQFHFLHSREHTIHCFLPLLRRSSLLSLRNFPNHNLPASPILFLHPTHQTPRKPRTLPFPTTKPSSTCSPSAAPPPPSPTCPSSHPPAPSCPFPNAAPTRSRAPQTHSGTSWADARTWCHRRA